MINPEALEGKIVNGGFANIPVTLSTTTRLLADEQSNLTDERFVRVQFTAHPLAIAEGLDFGVDLEGTIEEVGTQSGALISKDAESIAVDHINEVAFVAAAEGARADVDDHDRRRGALTAIGASLTGVTVGIGSYIIAEALITDEQSSKISWGAGSLILSFLLGSATKTYSKIGEEKHTELLDDLEAAEAKSLLARLLAGSVRGRNVVKEAVEAEVTASQQSPTEA